MNNDPLYVCKYRNKQGRLCPLRPGTYCSYAIGQCSSVLNPEHALKIFGIPIINKGETMMTTSKKKKKGFNFMRRSFLQVWTGKDGKIHSKARGSIEQNINNYNAMISYLKEQANSMAGSVVITLGDIPDVIIGTMTNNPKVRREETKNRAIQCGESDGMTQVHTAGGPYTLGGGGSGQRPSNQK